MMNQKQPSNEDNVEDEGTKEWRQALEILEVYVDKFKLLEATHLLEISGEKGFQPAAVELTRLYVHRIKNPDKASYWKKKAADKFWWLKSRIENGETDPRLLFCYAQSNDEGIGTPLDVTTAAIWYEKAANLGYIRAQYNIGVCYHHGEGVDKNFQKSLMWYETAAKRGFPAAQNNLGFCYGRGDGVPQNWEISASWYRKAAAQNDRTAQYNLGCIHEGGRGVAKDLNIAEYWYTQGFHTVDLARIKCFYKAIVCAEQDNPSCVEKFWASFSIAPDFASIVVQLLQSKNFKTVIFDEFLLTKNRLKNF
jgi:TPR repeat protein